MKYARVDGGKVLEVWVEPVYEGVLFPLSECFTPEVAALFQECPPQVEANWLFDGTNWTAPPVPDEPAP